LVCLIGVEEGSDERRVYLILYGSIQGGQDIYIKQIGQKKALGIKLPRPKYEELDYED
jgi:hypothetical protein